MEFKLEKNSNNGLFFKNINAKLNEVCYIEELDDHDKKLVTFDNRNVCPVIVLQTEDDISGVYNRQQFIDEVSEYIHKRTHDYSTDYVLEHIKQFARYIADRLLNKLTGENMIDYMDALIEKHDQGSTSNNDGLYYKRNDFVYDIFNEFEQVNTGKKKNVEDIITEYNVLKDEVHFLEILKKSRIPINSTPSIDHEKNVKEINTAIEILMDEIERRSSEFMNLDTFSTITEEKKSINGSTYITLFDDTDDANYFYVLDEGKDHEYMFAGVFDLIEKKYDNAVRCSSNLYKAEKDDPNYGTKNTSSFEFFRYLFIVLYGDFNNTKFVFEMIEKYKNSK